MRFSRPASTSFGAQFNESIHALLEHALDGFRPAHGGSELRAQLYPDFVYRSDRCGPNVPYHYDGWRGEGSAVQHLAKVGGNRLHKGRVGRYTDGKRHCSLGPTVNGKGERDLKRGAIPRNNELSGAVVVGNHQRLPGPLAGLGTDIP